MENSDTFLEAEDAMSSVFEVKSGMDELVNSFNVFRGNIKSKIKQTEDRINMLDRKHISLGRPVLSTKSEMAEPHQKAFNSYVRSGDDDGLRGLEVELKGLSVAVNGDGGYLVDPQTEQSVSSSLKGASSLRSIASVVTVEATSFDVLVDHGEFGSGWASETATVGETGTPQVDRISIPLHELSALPKASQRLLDDAAFDIEAWLAERISEKFARAEGAAFVSGDGVDKPKGFLQYDTVDAGSEEWGKLAHVRTGVSGDFYDAAPADALVDLIYALPARYRANATFVMNSRTAGRVRKLKDADGRFLWGDGLAAGEPARLLGYPVLISEDMPDIADWSASIAFGDFQKGYTIAERPDLRVLRDPFSAKPHVLFYATKRVGGDVTDFDAIKVLKFAAY